MADEFSWRSLNDRLHSMTETEVQVLLKQERDREPAPRATVLTRLHQRYTALRAVRERKELVG
tara:strand:- start:1471 stop:1659 length:189 start_codon:yes stop_codon:yes gene_type:complete